MPTKAPTCEAPRPLRPATAMRIMSLAPRTCPDDFVPATVMVAIAAIEPLTNCRRVNLVMAATPGRRETGVAGCVLYAYTAPDTAEATKNYSARSVGNT